jgi:phage repressor protein C with HTH and peptisase S24 domain
MEFGRLAPMNEVKKSLDRARELVRSRIEELGLDMAQVSRAIGRNHAYIQQYLKSGTPRELPEQTRYALAAILRVDGGDLISDVTRINPARPLAETGTNFPPNAHIASRVMLGADPKLRESVPVFVTARCGAEGGFEMNRTEPVEWRARTGKLAGVPGVYGVILDGDSMAPIHESGDLIYVSEILPPIVGRDVVIQLKPKADGDNPPAYLKRLVRRGATEVVCEQFNPKRTLTFKTNEILSIHRVLKLSEIV